MHQIGTPVKLLRDFCIEDRPIMHTGQVVHIMGSNHGSHDCLYVVTDGNYCFLASQEDFSLLPGREEGVEQQILAAFQAGYSKGLSRAIQGANNWGTAMIDVDAHNYLKELKDESRL